MDRTAKDYKKRIKRYLYNKGYGGAVEESVHHWNADTGEIKKPARTLPRANIRKEDYYNLFFRACTEFRDYINKELINT